MHIDTKSVYPERDGLRTRALKRDKECNIIVPYVWRFGHETEYKIIS